MTVSDNIQRPLGAPRTYPEPKAALTLIKPITWFPPMWAYFCGTISSGGSVAENWALVVLGVLLAGPIVCGMSQAANDWCDRHVDAINEPNRPIPSGAISEFDVQVQMYTLLFGGWAAAWTLDQWCEHDWPVVTVLVLFGSYISYIYSAPPLKLKQEGWRGNYALGASYIALPWWAGQAVFGELSLDVMVMTVLYSIAGLGIAIVNDFKSIEGDKALGMNSLPVAFGIDTAKWICVASIDVTQLGVAAYLWAIGETWYAAVLAGLVLPQMFSQISFLQDPVNNDVKYQAAAQPFLVFGILTTALAIGHHTF